MKQFVKFILLLTLITSTAYSQQNTIRRIPSDSVQLLRKQTAWAILQSWEDQDRLLRADSLIIQEWKKGFHSEERLRMECDTAKNVCLQTLVILKSDNDKKEARLQRLLKIGFGLGLALFIETTYIIATLPK